MYGYQNFKLARMRKLCILLLPVALLLTACPYGYHYNSVSFPSEPLNLGSLNSEYDDFNSASPIMGQAFPLCFSSKRNSQGKDFDIIYKFLNVVLYRSNGKIYIGEDFDAWNWEYSACQTIEEALYRINTGSNELGPYLIPVGDGQIQSGTGWSPYQRFIFMYASDDSGQLDIRFTQNVSANEWSSPKNIDFLNSTANDAYPVLNSDVSAIYFCSDRSGNFDIYHTGISHDSQLEDYGLVSVLSSSGSGATVRDSVLSSDSNDKCPFIFDSIMVFTSDRPGGYGGYDLYSSRFRNGKWQPPVNMGEKINSMFDEFRPIVRPNIEGFTNNLMIFSSNRPGGKGGYDLYYAGIK
jgi:hypothetical protein